MLLDHPEIPETTEDAAPPYPRPRYTPLIILRQYSVMVLTMLSSYRSSWYFHLFANTLLPLALVFFARAILGHADSQQAIFMLGGNMAMSITFGPTLFLIGQLGWSKQNKDFEYWVALPVSKTMLFIAIVSVSLVFALPGLLGTYIFGSLLLGLPFTGGWLLILLVPLSALSLTGLGALLGSISPNGQTSNLIGNLMLTFVGFLSPMLIPLQNLPAPLQVVARFIPTTYIADAFRVALGWHSPTPLPLDILILILSTIILLAIAQWKIDWRTT